MYAEPVPSICRKYIELRYRLIQFIYDAMFENTQCGKPICRPMFMDELKPGESSKKNLKTNFNLTLLLERCRKFLVCVGYRIAHAHLITCILGYK